MRFCKLILLTIISLFTVCICFGQDAQKTEIDSVKYFDENRRWYNEFTEHWFQFFDLPEEEIRNSIIQFEKISKDLKTSKNEWEGTYGTGGETHGSYLHWSENNGFVWLVVNKCNGGPMKVTRGKVLKTASSVKFIPEKILSTSFQQDGHSHNKTDEYKTIEFLFVKWRRVSYAVQADDIVNFANDAAGLNTGISGLNSDSHYFSKVFQESQVSLNELPVFPSGYEKFVKKPVKATIVSVGRTFRRDKKIAPDEEDNEYLKDVARNYDDLITEVTLNVGESSNIVPGVILGFIPDKEGYKSTGIKITKVFKNHSFGEYITDAPKKTCRKSEFENCETEERMNLSKGLKLSSTGEW